MISQDTASAVDLTPLEFAAQQGDTMLAQLMLTRPPLPVAHSIMTGLDSTTPGNVWLLGGLIFVGGVLVVWGLVEARFQAGKAAGAQVAREEAQRAETENLRAQHEHVLDLLRRRDRLVQQYIAVYTLSEQHYTEWERATWKEFARNQLAILQVVRPITYADYRDRILLLSPSYRRTLPGPALRAWEEARRVPICYALLEEPTAIPEGPAQQEEALITAEPATLDDATLLLRLFEGGCQESKQNLKKIFGDIEL